MATEKSIHNWSNHWKVTMTSERIPKSGYFSVILVFIFISTLRVERAEANDFPSLLVSNATMGESKRTIFSLSQSLNWVFDKFLFIFQLSYWITSIWKEIMKLHWNQSKKLWKKCCAKIWKTAVWMSNTIRGAKLILIKVRIMFQSQKSHSDFVHILVRFYGGFINSRLQEFVGDFSFGAERNIAADSFNRCWLSTISTSRSTYGNWNHFQWSFHMS